MIGMVTFSAAQTRIMGFSEKNINNEHDTETEFDKNLDSQNIGATIRKLSEKPHHLGSPGQKENAGYILDLFKQWGWDAEIETFYVLFPTPVIRILEMISPVSYKALLREPVIKGDPSTQQKGQLPPYNAYSADGDITSGLVYVNYGLPEDYAVLDRMGIDVKGKIVIARYGKSWRGIKPKIAQERGAAGCILYSDPMEDGYFMGDVYPDGAFRNKYGVQRGSVMDWSGSPGDPLTPGKGATKAAERIDRSESPAILRIPVLPISYNDAAPFLQALDGPVVPESWQGALPFTYHTGTGKTKVHLKVSFNWDLVPCYDVIARIQGDRFPDQWVIRGNHQDAWVNGATDPVSGLAAMLEEARSMGEMMKTGWRPARTIVYCAWDGEEPGLLGSTEWVEEHVKELKEKAVLYINTDGSGRGFLYVEGSPALTPFIDQISKQITDPQTNVNLFQRRKAHETISSPDMDSKRRIWNRSELEIDALGSGSDYAAFIHHAGIPSLNIWFGGENYGGEYHSAYDTYALYEKFKDPGFQYGVVLAKTAGHAVLRMAQADALPFDFRYLFYAVDAYTNELINLLNERRDFVKLENSIIAGGGYAAGEDPLKKIKLPEIKAEVPYIDFSLLQNAVRNLGKSIEQLNKHYFGKMGNDSISEFFNQSLYKAEQQLLSATGLPGRDWYKHSLYAPGSYSGYAVKTLPGIREALEQENWDEASEQIKSVADIIVKLSVYFNSLTSSN